MMKKNVLFAFAALIAVSSCTSEINEEGFVDKANSISFNAYSNKSRALDTDITSDNMNQDNSGFGVVGYTHDNNKIYLYKGSNVAVQQTWDRNSWEYADKGDLKFWPKVNMDFYAYFPYSETVTFTSTNSSGDVMTIKNVDCSHDVLFAFVGDQEKTTRVPLNFYHAFAKIKGLVIELPTDGNLYKSHCQIEVEKVEFINTSTKGDVNVDYQGKATYTVSDPNATLNKTLNTNVLVQSVTDKNSGILISNGTSAAGYFFATNSTEAKNVIGTGKAMWDGKNDTFSESDKLSNKGLVCLKLTCKVWNGADDDKYYYVGGDSSFGEIYIPLKGNTDSDPSTSVTTFDAGKRYTYTIKMKDNVGFDDNGDPILTPILFKVSSVVGWDDVAVTITL